MIQANIIADSLNKFGNRITTFVVVMPRIVLAEFNTHRMFSRNSASSRAIPFNKMVKMVEENPFIPIAWQKDHKGMQGTEYIDDPVKIEELQSIWLYGRDKAVETAKALQSNNGNDIPVTKQLCNRLLEPFMWHTVIVTATEWENFFKLRCPQYPWAGKYYRSKKELINSIKVTDEVRNNVKEMTDLDWLNINKSQAEIHIQAVAECMWDTYNESTPKQLKAGEWHIPYGDNFDGLELNRVASRLSNGTLDFNTAIEQSKIKIATARCARLSYQTLGDNPTIDYEADIRLHDMLAESGHWSPSEHCAQAMSYDDLDNYILISEGKVDAGVCNNFKGFKQYRKTIEQ